MISRIRGTLLRRDLERAEVMTPSGVAYEIEIPLSVYERLPAEGAEVEFRTHYLVRQDGVSLYGFLGETERTLFARLITASGIGPRDRKSTRLNSSHVAISYAVFCLKKKKSKIESRGHVTTECDRMREAATVAR